MDLLIGIKARHLGSAEYHFSYRKRVLIGTTDLKLRTITSLLMIAKNSNSVL